MGGEWNDSIRSKEQVEASLLNKQEAAMRRERALAYAFSHQVHIYSAGEIRKRVHKKFLVELE